MPSRFHLIGWAFLFDRNFQGAGLTVSVSAKSMPCLAANSLVRASQTLSAFYLDTLVCHQSFLSHNRFGLGCQFHLRVVSSTVRQHMR